ncbi:hypothetical protein E8E13_000953 [Curvularia kusanoi]|uniref:Uncharacterized protein n=1 Tax=Curvularia kusanoi TaxID=90978 RepID=A0A9P4TG73_CURKU|nr:hypothetical protein E8E13_000953 [Curvularia kusanoi]
MPAERRSFSATRPAKTERTHGENQERAYIAASRRSDRSLEARIESARRASEIHKERTGRALRVTERDVINNEMYEEEDDDLPTQYQRLNAHLHTSSVVFNKKLHDYIATQHGIRSMFMSQYQNLKPSFAGSRGNQLPQQNNARFGENNWLNPTMVPLQQINQQIQQSSTQPQQAPLPQGVRASPYHIPQRSPHGRAASIAVPVDPPMQHGAQATQEEPRQSLPTQAGVDDQPRPALSRGSSFAQQPTSPALTDGASPMSSQRTPQIQADNETPASAFKPMNHDFGSPMLSGPNPLSMALPAELQQFVGSIFDPNDPRIAVFLSGSEHLAQPFTPTYTYNPNYSPKALKTDSNMTPMP